MVRSLIGDGLDTIPAQPSLLPDAPPEPDAIEIPDPTLLRRFVGMDPDCIVQSYRGKPFDTKTWGGERLTWQVSIHSGRVKAWERIAVEHKSINAAMEACVVEAEARGWHRPRTDLRPS